MSKVNHIPGHSITTSGHAVVAHNGVDGCHQGHNSLELSGAGVATCSANISLELFDLVLDQQILYNERTFSRDKKITAVKYVATSPANAPGNVHVRVVQGIHRDARCAGELVCDAVQILDHVVGMVVDKMVGKRRFPEGVGSFPIALYQTK